MPSFEKIQSNVFAAVSAMLFTAIFVGASVLPAEAVSVGGLLV